MAWVDSCISRYSFCPHSTRVLFLARDNPCGDVIVQSDPGDIWELLGGHALEKLQKIGGKILPESRQNTSDPAPPPTSGCCEKGATEKGY